MVEDNVSRLVNLTMLAAAVIVILAACGTSDADSPEATSTEAPAPTTTVGSSAPTTAALETTTSTTAPASTTTVAPTTAAVPQPEADHILELTVVDGRLTEEPSRYDVGVGETVLLRISSDTSDEIHVHGYDLYADITPSAPGVLEFVADIPGIFEIELESQHLLVAELRVS